MRDARRVRDVVREALERVARACGITVGRLRQRDSRAEHAVRIEAGVHLLQRERAANQQSGADEQQQRQRDFGGDQACAQPIAKAAARRSAAAFAQSRLDRAAREAKRGREAAQNAACDRDRERESERDGIDARLLEPRHARRARRDDPGDEPLRQHEAGGRRRQRQHRAFGQQLAHDAAPAGAERGADGDFASTGGAAREQQVRDVAARDQQHESDGAQQDEQTRSIAADELLAKRLHRVAELAGVAWEVVAQPHGDGLELLQRLLDRGAAREPAVHRQVVLVVHRLAFSRERDRDPQLLAVARQIERGRHHARHDRVAAVDSNRCADDRASAEAAYP